MTAPPLVHGPCTPPSLRKGDRAHCLLRDCPVFITSWTDARIPWPRCQPLHTRGGSGILLDEELARAVRMESALAIMHWWGVSEGVIWRWRRALSVTRTGNPSTHALITANAHQGGEASREGGVTPEERQRRSGTARRLKLQQHSATTRPLNRGGDCLAGHHDRSRGCEADGANVACGEPEAAEAGHTEPLRRAEQPGAEALSFSLNL